MKKTSQLSLFLILVISIHTSMGQDDCPKLAELAGSPTLSQINSSYIKIDGSNVLASNSINQSCIEDQKVFVLTDPPLPGSQVQEVSACQDYSFDYRVKFKGADEFIHSEAVTGRVFKRPKFNDSALDEMGNKNITYIPKAANGPIDMTRISITGSQKIIAENYECRKVTAVELFVTLEGEDEPFVTKHTEDLNFKVEFDGLNQLCKSYSIGIRLIGTEGTEPVEDHAFKTLAPVSKSVDVMQKAKNSNYVHKFGAKIEKATYKAINPQSVEITWSPVDDECFTEYLVKVMKNPQDTTEIAKDKAHHSHTFSNLEPCTDYTALVNIYLGGKGGNDGVIFEGCKHTRKEFNFKTLPDLKSDFALKNLKIDTSSRCITVTWTPKSCIYTNLNISVCDKDGSHCSPMTLCDNVARLDRSVLKGKTGDFSLKIEKKTFEQIVAEDSKALFTIEHPIVIAKMNITNLPECPECIQSITGLQTFGWIVVIILVLMALAILAMIVINKILENNPEYQQMKTNVLEFVSCKNQVSGEDEDKDDKDPSQGKDDPEDQNDEANTTQESTMEAAARLNKESDPLLRRRHEPDEVGGAFSVPLLAKTPPQKLETESESAPFYSDENAEDSMPSTPNERPSSQNLDHSRLLKIIMSEKKTSPEAVKEDGVAGNDVEQDLNRSFSSIPEGQSDFFSISSSTPKRKAGGEDVNVTVEILNETEKDEENQKK